jgi:hypothetical protein
VKLRLSFAVNLKARFIIKVKPRSSARLMSVLVIERWHVRPKRMTGFSLFMRNKSHLCWWRWIIKRRVNSLMRCVRPEFLELRLVVEEVNS